MKVRKYRSVSILFCLFIFFLSIIYWYTFNDQALQAAVNVSNSMTLDKTVGGQDDEYTLGLVINEAVYDTVKTLPRFGSTKNMTLPYKVDLRPYAPTPASQGKIGSCVGWALGYNALTIQQAIERGWEGAAVTHNALSALYLYNQVKIGDCYSGALMPSALEFLKTYGDCSARFFDLDVNDCYKEPSYELRNEASKYVIKDYMALFDSKESPAMKILKLKQSLVQDRPPIIALLLRRNIIHVNSSTDYLWEAEVGDTRFWGGHAVTVVGYDDGRKAFQIMNSWGTRWADRGFVWVKYKDMGRFCKYAYQIHIHPVVRDYEEIFVQATDTYSPLIREERRYDFPVVRAGHEENKSKKNVFAKKNINNNKVTTIDWEKARPANFEYLPPTKKKDKRKKAKRNKYKTVEKQKKEQVAQADNGGILEIEKPSACLGTCLGGNFSFQYLADVENVVFETAQAYLKDNYYRLKKGRWKVGQLFQLEAVNDIKDEYMYVFSVDSQNKIEIHWPRQNRLDADKFLGLNETSLIPFEGAKVVIPNEESALQLAHSGKDYLCVLFSCQEVNDFKQLTQRIQSANPSFTMRQRIEMALGNRLIPEKNVKYLPEKIAFKTCPDRKTKGNIVALILEVEAE